jgi:hypothetical protein
MAKKLKKWTKETYTSNAKDFVACYGVGYCWSEFINEYMQLWDEPGSEYEAPDPDTLYSAIRDAEKNFENR